jgi:hypothetical protein
MAAVEEKVCMVMHLKQLLDIINPQQMSKKIVLRDSY